MCKRTYTRKTPNDSGCYTWVVVSSSKLPMMNMYYIHIQRRFILSTPLRFLASPTNEMSMNVTIHFAVRRRGVKRYHAKYTRVSSFDAYHPGPTQMHFLL